MRIHIKLLTVVSSIKLWISIWFIFATYYAFSLKYNFHTIEADYVAYFVQMMADFFMITFSTLAFTKPTDKESKKFYLFIAISILPGMISTEAYNILVNLIKVKNIDSLINQIWIFPYTFFLILQIFSWSYLLAIRRAKEQLTNSIWVSYFPYIQSVMIILMSIYFIIAFNGLIFTNMGYTECLNTALEAILFVLISVCLSRTMNTSLIYIETGFLLLVAFNLAHRLSYLTGHYYKTFDMVWLISYVIIVYGFSLSIKRQDDKIVFFKPNSIHVLICALFTMFATFLLIIFLSLGFFISSIEINDVGSLNIFPESIPSILVFTFSLSVLIGKLIAEHFSKPLERISHRIDIIKDAKFDPSKILAERFEIYEIDRLDKFIMCTIEELRSANRIKSEFLMNMSHDFRTPASGIYHMSRSVQRRLMDPELKKLQQLIVDSSEQLMNILEDVLDYSRLDNGKYELNVNEFDVRSIINDIILFVSAKVKEKRLNLDACFSKSQILYKGDRQMLHRIMLNIISNAIKFTDTGNILVTVFEEKINSVNYLVIKVKDSGIGIDKCHHKTIFEPFTRVESSETAKYPGIGLGLSNVFLMLKKMEGHISVNSTLNKGTTFTVTIPTN